MQTLRFDQGVTRATEVCSGGTCARTTIGIDLALGEAFSCALQGNGNITCWGSDEHRALGPRRLHG